MKSALLLQELFEEWVKNEQITSAVKPSRRQPAPPVYAGLKAT
jgi:hypothetical protein